MKRAGVWRRWVDLFEAPENPDEPRYDPVHLAVVLTACMVVIGATFWLLWTLFVYEGGLPGKGWRANLAAAAVALFVVGLLFKADRRHARARRR